MDELPRAEPGIRVIHGLDVASIRARPYGKWKYLRWNDIIHLAAEDAAITCCLKEVPRHYDDVTRRIDTITCVECCRNVMKRYFRIY